MAKIPDRLNIDKKTDRELYDALDNEKMLRFKDKGGIRTRKEQFLFAMSIGFKNKSKRPLESKEGFFLLKDMRPDEEALINAVAIADTDSIEVLSKKEDVFKIAEEYAHAGIKLLVDKIQSTQFGSFDKQFEKELLELYKELDLGKDGKKDTTS